MNRRCLIWSLAAALIVLVIIAITVTLILVLRKHHKKSDEQSLNEIISENSTFPDGSYQFSVSDLKTGTLDESPDVLPIWMLKMLNLVVDDSSMVAETNRLSYLFVRLTPTNNTSDTRTKRQTTTDDKAIGVRFGDSDTIHIIPRNLTSIYNSGLSSIGTLPDGSQVFQIQVRMGDAMCSRQDYGSCSVAKWTPYSIENGDAVVGSAAQFDNDLPVACGSQCDAKSDSPCATSSCSQCDGQQVAGANTPVTRRYNMGTKQAANLQFLYETYTVPDRITVTYEGDEIFDSGCVGTEGERTTPIGFDGNSMEVRVDVEPNCDGTTSTAWYFTLPCVDGPPTTPPQPNTTSPIPSTTSGDCRNRQCSEYKCLDDTRAHCGPSGYLLSFGYKYCNRFVDNTNLFTSAGKRFFECVRPRLMEYMEDYLDSTGDSVDCDDLKLKAFDSHVPIFRDCDYCDMIFLNAPQFLYVVAGELVTEPLARKEACDLMAMCPMAHTEICSFYCLGAAAAGMFYGQPMPTYIICVVTCDALCS